MRYGIAIILVVIFAILAIVLLGRGDNNARSTAKTSRFTVLADYADKDSASVSWTMQGRILGDDQFRSVRITVTPHTRTIELLDGYNQTVEKKNDYGNTAAGYQTLLKALDLQNFGKERNVKNPDERGFCPLGNRFIYRLQDGSEEVMRTWSDSCLTADGPYGGTNPSLVAQIFKNQIPNYSKFIENVQF